MNTRKLLRYGPLPILFLSYYFTLLHLDLGDPHRRRHTLEAMAVLFVYLVLYSFWKQWADRYANKKNWK